MGGGWRLEAGYVPSLQGFIVRGAKMARMQLLQRIASTHILSQCAGPRASRVLKSSTETFYRPAISWLIKYSSWSAAIPQHYHSLEVEQNWIKRLRYFSLKVQHEEDEVSVPKDTAIEDKHSSAKKALDGGARFNVVRVNDDGSWHHLSLKTSELVRALILLTVQSLRLLSVV